MFGPVDEAVAGKLIATLTVLTAPLAVALTGDRGVAASRPADHSSREHQIDARQDVVDPFRMMLDAARAATFRWRLGPTIRRP